MSYELIYGESDVVLFVNGKKYTGVTDSECFEKALQDEEE